MGKIKLDEKCYIEVEVDIEHGPDSVWIVHPDHPANEYSGICVYKKHLIPKREMEKRKRRTQKGEPVMIPKYKKYMGTRPFTISDRGNAVGVYNFLNGTFTPVAWQGSIEATYEAAADECERLFTEHRKEQQ